MTKKLYLPLALLMVFSMILSACGTPAAATEVAASRIVAMSFCEPRS